MFLTVLGYLFSNLHPSQPF